MIKGRASELEKSNKKGNNGTTKLENTEVAQTDEQI